MRTLCVGTLLVDVITQAMDTEPAWEGGACTGVEIHPGGNGFNVAVDLVKLGISAPTVCCMGAVGDDLGGRLFASELARYQLQDGLKRVSGGRTGTSIILQIRGRERTFVVDKGTSRDVAARDVLDALERLRPDLLYIGVGALVDIQSHLDQILAAAKQRGCTTVVDYVIIGDYQRELLLDCLRLIDVLHCNEYESRLLTGEDDPRDAVLFFGARGSPLVFVSQGGDELWCGCHGRPHSFSPFPVECQDPTGAGDAFTAGLIAQLLSDSNPLEPAGMDETRLRRLAQFAMAAGAAAVTRLGCTTGVSRSAVSAILAAQPGA